MKAYEKMRLECLLNKADNIKRACEYLLKHQDSFDDDNTCLKQLNEEELSEFGNMLRIKDKYKEILDKVKD